MIVGYVVGQALTIDTPVIASDSVNYIEARFVFLNRDWDGLAIHAIFDDGDVAYACPLKDGRVAQDNGLNLGAGTWRVHLVGSAMDGDVLVRRITTNPAKIEVVCAGRMDGEPVPPARYTDIEEIEAALTKKIDAPQVAQVGEVLTVEAVDTDGKPTKWKTAPAPAEQKQADWNQNDETAADYVKNRPFYVVRTEEILGNTQEDYYNACVAAEGTGGAEIIRCIVIDGVRYEYVKPLYSSSTVAYSIGGHTLKVDRRYGGISLSPAADYYFIKITDNFHQLNREFLPNGNLVNGNARGSMRSIVSNEESDDYQLGEYSFDFSARGKVTGGYSVAFGMDNEISGDSSMACGNGNSVSGMESFACGRNNSATGAYSFCCGATNTAGGVSSFASGINNKASGRSSYTAGESNIVQHDYAVALGYCLTTGKIYQTVVGACNVSDISAIFVVGNGYSTSNGSHITRHGSNAMSVSINGDGWFAGDVYVGSTSGTNRDGGSVRLATMDDLPQQKSLKWITVHSSDLTEETTEIVVSADPTGKAIADYNPVGLTLIISTPADATQTDNNGAPWVYPSATKKDNAIRVIGSIAGWKTTARDSVFAFYGGSSAMTCTGNGNVQLATYKIDGYALDGVTAMLNGNTNHFPVGTHVEVAILCEVAE